MMRVSQRCCWRRERVDKNILGMDLLDGLVQRGVAQVAVSFTGHRLLHPRPATRGRGAS